MGVERPPRISFPDLMETARTFPDEVRADANRQTFKLAASIIRHFLGQRWYEDRIIQDAVNSRPRAPCCVLPMIELSKYIEL
jgi:hypothetical protein